MPEEGATFAGYATLIAAFTPRVPAPDYLCAFGSKYKKYEAGRWRIFTPRHKPDDSLHGHLVFALKYEGLDLAVLKALFDSIDVHLVADLLQGEPTGAYSRKIWFLYEWLWDERLDIEDAKQGNFVDLVNGTLQYLGACRDSRRHRVRNNPPDCKNFCPIIRRTEKLDRFIAQDLSQAAIDHIGKTSADLVRRAEFFFECVEEASTKPYRTK